MQVARLLALIQLARTSQCMQFPVALPCCLTYPSTLYFLAPQAALQPHLGYVLPCVLDGLSDEAEGVRDAALAAGALRTWIACQFRLMRQSYQNEDCNSM